MAPGGPATGRPKKVQPKLSRPEVKMRQFNWAKLPDLKTMDTVWGPGGASDENVKLDLNEIEQLFSLAEAKKVEKKDEDEPAKKQAVSVLDPKRAQNTSIMLARFKMPYADLRKAIEDLDETILTVDNLTSLKQCIPTPDEIAALKEIEDPATLSAPDKYFLEVSKVHNMGPRLECMLTKNTFAKKAETINTSVSVISQAINEIKNSKKFVRFLEVVLKIGNMINTGSARGGAYGFKLDTLTKLGDMRSSNKDLPTLLHFIAVKGETEFPEVIEMVKDFEALPLACKESLSQVVSDLAALNKSVEFVGNQVKNPPETPDKYYNVMSEFYSKASQQVSMLDSKLKKTQEAFTKTAEYYGEPASTPAEQLFNTVWAAVQALERAKGDIEKKKQAEAKAKEAEERRQKMREKTNAGKPATPGAGGPDRNVMDNLIGQMHTGDAFAAKRAATRAPGGPRPPGAAPDGGQQMVANEAMAIFARMKQKRDGN